jgi:hypothetical protein
VKLYHEGDGELNVCRMDEFILLEWIMDGMEKRSEIIRSAFQKYIFTPIKFFFIYPDPLGLE